MYCGEVPSSLLPGPVTDHSAGPSAAPPDPCVSLIVVTTLLAAVSIVTVRPVPDVGLLRSSEKSSTPSINASSLSGKSITTSVIDAPSAGAV